MAKMGRPRKQISKEEFEKLCVIQCTQEECAAWFDCDMVTFQRWVKMTYRKTFSQVFAQKRGKGKISLRRSLYQRAVNPEGPPAIAIFLAKNYLGMSDKVENTVQGPKEESRRLIIQYAPEDKKTNE